MGDIRDLVPQSKFDFERAEAAIRAGYPAVAQILGELMEWLKDNWPISLALNQFLSTIGEPLVPHIWNVLRSDDDAWKYWTMGLIRTLPESVAAQFRAELTRLCYAPQPDEKANDLNEKAEWVLEHFGWLR